MGLVVHEVTRIPHGQEGIDIDEVVWSSANKTCNEFEYPCATSSLVRATVSTSKSRDINIPSTRTGHKARTESRDIEEQQLYRLPRLPTLKRRPTEPSRVLCTSPMVV